jgi:dihydroorotate dehydrogenase
MNKPDMSVNIAGIKLRNPVMTASGTLATARSSPNMLIWKRSALM